MWLKDPDVRFSRLSVTPSDDNSLYWVDESNKILCLAFPAILEKKVSSLIRDIKGKKKKLKIKQNLRIHKCFDMFLAQPCTRLESLQDLKKKKVHRPSQNQAILFLFYFYFFTKVRKVMKVQQFKKKH